MAKSLLSQDWYRVAPLRPRLRGHVEIHRQRFRGETWYIVQDAHSGKYHRLGPAANLMVSLMDGRRSLQTLWEAACERFEEDPPTQSDVIRLLSQLHHADLIAGDVPPDIAELGRRHREQARRSLLARLRNPLMLRLPLFDPDAFLESTVGLVRPLFTAWGFLAWLGLIVAGVTAAALNWQAITGDITDRVLSAENLVLIALAYPVIKLIHELGHAYATKVWGGEVREVGLMLLVFVPVPYVDASASAAFPEKWRRAVVGGAGIMVELALAAAAALVWVNVEPGLVRAFAFNVMLIGGVSTLLFNGNPLLRFDGYFVLSDLLEIPNLGQRSTKYFWYLVQRYLLRLPDADSPVTARGERGWLFAYAVASFPYRLFLSIGIALFIATKFFILGILLALWSLASVLVLPLLKGLKFLFTSKALRGRRLAAVATSGAIAAALLGAVFALPVPHRTLASAVIWLDEAQIIRAGSDGFVADAPIESARVAAGEILLRLEDPILDSEARLAAAQLQEIRLRLGGVAGADAVQASLLREQARHLEGRLELFEARRAALEVAAPRDGRALIPYAADLPGRLVEQGAVLGYLMPEEGLRLRVAVPQSVAELVRASDGVEFRLERDPRTAVPARIAGAAPESQPILPSPALSSDAGGPFALDPSDPEGRRILESVFVFDVVPTAATPAPFVGERAVVRFDHGPEPLGFRIARGIRQLFLARFNV